MEHSKFITRYAIILVTAIVVFACVMMAITKDLSSLTELLIGAFAALTAIMGFYFDKAKAENKIKLKKSLGIKITEGDIEEEEL